MKKAILLSAVFLLVFVSNGFSQVSGTSATARLTGVLTDPSGAAVGGVHLQASSENVSNAMTFTAVSDSEGKYSLSLPSGKYRVQFTREPFVARELSLELGPGETRHLDLRLELQPLSASVVVTAQALPVETAQSPASITTYTSQQISERKVSALADLLLFAPSISIGRTGTEGGTTSIFIGGGNSNFTKVLVDGTPVNEPGSAVDFSNFTLDNIDKVEVVRGAESALYGTDAVSGVIQVFTHRGTTRTPAVDLFAEGGGFSAGRGGARISGLVGPFDYSAAASYFQTAGQGPNDSFLNRTLSGNFGWSFSGTNQLRLSLRNNTSDAGIPGQTLLEPPNLDQHNALHYFSASARWDFTTGTHWRHEIRGAEAYERELFHNPAQDFFNPSDPICPQLSPTAVPSAFCDFPFTAKNQFNRAGFSAQSSYLLPQASFTAGYQYEVENAFLSALNGAHARRNNQGGFLDVRWIPFSRFSLNAGLRAEDNQNFGTRVVPRLGGAFVIHMGQGLWGDTRLRAFYGQGIKEPRLDQSFGTDPCFPGNPALRPERSRTWDAGIEQKLASDRVRVSAEYFQNRFYDITSFTFCFTGGPCPVAPPPACGFGFGTYFNTDLARARGANIEIEARPARWLSVAVSYSYDDTRVLVSPNAFDPAEIPGNRLLRRPLNSGSLILNAAYRRLNWNFAGYFTAPRTDSDFLGLGLTRDAGYARFDIATSYDFGRGVSAYGRVANLFDKQYQDAIGFPALGREVRVGMNYRFGGKD
jgi:outer membrane cobalamin receptor